MDNTSTKDIVISICTGTGGIAAGGMKVIAAFDAALAENGIAATCQARTHKVGCRGFCAKDVLVDVSIDGVTEIYQFVTPDRVPQIVKDHIMGGKAVQKWLVKNDYRDFHNKQEKLVLANCGRIDPESIEEYMETGGYRAVRKALAMPPEEVIHIIKASGLRGRGGGGVPTGVKWESCPIT